MIVNTYNLRPRDGAPGRCFRAEWTNHGDGWRADFYSWNPGYPENLYARNLTAEGLMFELKWIEQTRRSVARRRVFNKLVAGTR